MVGRLLPFLLDPLGKVYNFWVSMLNFHGILPFEHRELDCIESSSLPGRFQKRWEQTKWSDGIALLGWFMWNFLGCHSGSPWCGMMMMMMMMMINSYHTHTHIYIYINVFIYKHTNIHTHIHIHLHLHIHKRTHTHTYAVVFKYANYI